ncbi:hypothetical protein CK203_107088 [Vitis vinifera]|uniref:Uncharacterized protein n=1 Tax=Vitis vinifera TaxID=29760 RepID=A0A438E7J3_VITVI|nr:hypothetical protein CK203_107088 [Vitis vinifera]
MNCFCYCWMLKLVLINTVDPAPQISCQHLTKLSDLDLSYNEISGSFPSWLNSDLQLYVS